MNNKVLYQPWGGLGDNLQYSTLPRRFAELGYDFYISEQNVCRNSEIFDLVWKHNPYVKGVDNGLHYNVGDIPFNRQYTQKSVVYNQEASHGLEPINEVPEIYYKPNHVKDYTDIVLIDLNSVSAHPVAPVDFILQLKQQYPDKQFAVPNFVTKVSKQSIQIDDVMSINISNIYDYCDLIISCHHFVCAFSGQSVLASALNKQETTCYVSELHKHSFYIFPNITYKTISYDNFLHTK